MTNRSIECVYIIYHETWKFKDHPTRDGEVNGFHPWKAWEDHCMGKDLRGSRHDPKSHDCPKQKGEL